MSLPAAFPSGLDALANPTATSECDDAGFELDLVVSRIHDILEALEAKVGIGASLPSAAGVLRQTAPGVTGWGAISAAEITDGVTVKQLKKTVVTTAQPGVSFTGIPAGYSALRIAGYLRSSAALTFDPVFLRVGTGSLDASASYDIQSVAGGGTTPQAIESYGQTFALVGSAPGANATAGRFATFDIVIPNYAVAGTSKVWTSTYCNVFGTSGGAAATGVYGGCWRPTTAIDAVGLFLNTGPNAVTGSVVTVWGLP